MSNKRIQVSDDAGANYYTLPGNQGDFKNNLSATDDTVFGQTFQSQQPNLADWMITSNGIFKGVSGYNAVIKKAGTPTTMTAEACALVSGKTYRITNAAKRVISYLDALTVLDNGVDHTADVLSIDYLSGAITFKSAYTPTTPITVTGKYIPLSVMAKAKSFHLTQSQATTDVSCYDTAQANNGHRVFGQALRTVTLEVGHIFAASNAWLTALLARGIVYVEIDLDATNPGLTVARGFFKITSRGQSGNQGDVEAETVALTLWVPDGALVAFPFAWYISGSSTLNTAVQKCITAYINQTNIRVQYLPTGATGQSPVDGVYGDAVMAECSLANTIDGQNEFSFSFKGTNAPTPV